MSDVDLLRRAAKVARADTDPRWNPIATWLEPEAADLAESTDTTKPLGYAARHIHHNFGPAVRAARALLNNPKEKA